MSNNKCTGKLILVNGVSSTGKTTFALKLKKFGYYHIEADEVIDDMILEQLIFKYKNEILNFLQYCSKKDLFKVLYNIRFDQTLYTKQQIALLNNLSNKLKIEKFQQIKEVNIYKNISQKILLLLCNNKNVILDIVISSDEKLELLNLVMNNHSYTHILVYNDLPINLLKCYMRNEQAKISDDIINFRLPSLIIEQYFEFYETCIFPIQNSNIISSVKKQYIDNFIDYAIDYEIQLIKYKLNYDVKEIYEYENSLVKLYTDIKKYNITNPETTIYLSSNIMYDLMLINEEIYTDFFLECSYSIIDACSYTCPVSPIIINDYCNY